MFIHVVSVDVSSRDYHLRLAFDDDTELSVDLSQELDGEVFEPLKDPGFFCQVRLNNETGTIEWPNGADFAPEFLLELGRKQNRISA